MKKIILFSFFILSSAMMTSCTADALTDVKHPSVQTDDDTGGQQGIPIPPPPPPPHGIGSGKTR